MGISIDCTMSIFFLDNILMGEKQRTEKYFFGIFAYIDVKFDENKFFACFFTVTDFFMSYSLVSFHSCFVHLLRLYMYGERYIDKSKTHAFALFSKVLFFFFVEFNIIYFCYYVQLVCAIHFGHPLT